MAAKYCGTLVVGFALFGIMGCQDSKVPQPAAASGGGNVVVSDDDASVRQQRINDVKEAVDAAIKKNASSG